MIWAIFMLTMFLHIFANWRITMGGKKAHIEYYKEAAAYDKVKLFEYIKDQNYKSWGIALAWISICMLFFCPFQRYMENRCCVNCRIFDWGHFMMFTPMVFIKNFFTWTLFLTSIIVLIRWELTYAKYPERFWCESNETLRCENCRDKLCQVKHPYVKK
jgi:hypothetical protein